MPSEEFWVDRVLFLCVVYGRGFCRSDEESALCTRSLPCPFPLVADLLFIICFKRSITMLLVCFLHGACAWNSLSSLDPGVYSLYWIWESISSNIFVCPWDSSGIYIRPLEVSHSLVLSANVGLFSLFCFEQFALLLFTFPCCLLCDVKATLNPNQGIFRHKHRSSYL